MRTDTSSQPHSRRREEKNREVERGGRPPMMASGSRIWELGPIPTGVVITREPLAHKRVEPRSRQGFNKSRGGRYEATPLLPFHWTPFPKLLGEKTSSPAIHARKTAFWCMPMAGLVEILKPCSPLGARDLVLLVSDRSTWLKNRVAPHHSLQPVANHNPAKRSSDFVSAHVPFTATNQQVTYPV